MINIINILEEVIRINALGHDAILITVVDKNGQGPSGIGNKMLIDDAGAKSGSIGGGELEFLAVKKAQELMVKKEHSIEKYNLSGDQPDANSNKLNMICGGEVTLFFEYLPVRPSIYIMGMGHVGNCLAYVMTPLRWHIIRVEYKQISYRPQDNLGTTTHLFADIIERGAPSRECFVVIAGYSHDEDYQVLEAIYQANWQPRYIGLVASSQKSRLMVNRLVRELGQNINLGVLHAPVGLNIGGNTPEEIALSIAAEIQSIRYGKKGNQHLGTNWVS